MAEEAQLPGKGIALSGTSKNLYFEIILGLQKSCKNSIDNSHIPMTICPIIEYVYQNKESCHCRIPSQKVQTFGGFTSFLMPFI